MATIKFYTPISAAAFKTILQHIPKLQNVRPGDVFIHSPGEILSIEPPAVTVKMHGEYHPMADTFLGALYECGFVQDYDWFRFEQRAVDYYNHPERLRRAPLQTCVKLLTLHSRRDRFVDGHFAKMLADGHLTAILSRLEELNNLRSRSGNLGPHG